VTVDALTGLGSLQRHPVALRQLLAADDLVVTKADLVPAAAVEDVVGHLRTVNPSASVRVSADGRLLRTVRRPAGDRSGARVQAVPEESHTAGIATVELVTEEPLDWQAFAVWLSMLVHRRGPDVLRVKALLDVRDAGPVALHGVQHVIHRPEHLDRAAFRGSRVVLIVRDLDPELLERSFRTFLGVR
jgi:G3E family GTPase